jgi:DNA mismatch repair protein MutS
MSSTATVSLYDEYENYVIKYKKEYGDGVIVLYQCGSFYEIYSAGDDLVNIKDISELLNIQMSRRNKAILEVNRSNTLMAGFPDYTLDKFLNILVDHNYTVVVVSQVSPPPKPKRAVTQIVSPGTRMVHKTYESNNIMSIYIEQGSGLGAKGHTQAHYIGFSILDLTTGVLKVGEHTCLSDLYRVITIYNPREFIIFGNSTVWTADYIAKYLSLSSCIHDKINLYPREYNILAYQNTILKNIYPDHGLLTPIEYISMEKLPLALISLIMALNFAYNHNETIVKKLKLPELINPDDKLIISYNAIDQLNLNSLLQIINTCDTACGKRYFKERFLNPYINPQKMSESYDCIAYLLEDKRFLEISKILSQVYDLERLFRKLKLRTLQPADFIQIISSVNAIIQLDKYKMFNMCEKAQLLLGHIKETFDDTKIAKYYLDNISENFFNASFNSELDELQKQILDYKSFYDHFVRFFLDMNMTEGQFKYDYNDRDGSHFIITSKRYNELAKKIKDKTFTWKNYTIKLCELETKNISANNSNIKVCHKVFTEICNIIKTYNATLNERVLEEYYKVLGVLEDKFGNYFTDFVSYLCEMDYANANAKNAHYFRYHRPSVGGASGASAIKVTDLRHPLVERIQKNIQYISNSIELSSEGVLLYGINSAGKSTFMKSIGISIIMAQAGMYVPCSSLELVPYKTIFTRIPSGDDINKGQSTFTIEILELRNILKNVNQNSLVIGDELCHGTESVSAISIVSSGILELCEKQASFIFATHLHDLTKISKIQQITNLKIYHLSVIYDEIQDKLIYNRVLTLGQGNTLYGLEVCKSLGLDRKFIEQANEIRKELLDLEIFKLKNSSYNSEKYVYQCEICKEKLRSQGEVHHIKQQMHANPDGFITDSDIHKNDMHNLVAICTKCHDEIHRDNIKISGYIQTSNGVELNYQKEPKTDDCKHLVKDLVRAGKTKVDILKILASEHNVYLTNYKLNKIIKEII